VIAVKSMLIEIKKKNVELDNFYNVIINERAKYEIEYEKSKKRIEKLEHERDDENENMKSFDVFVESMRDASIRINVSAFVMTTINIATSKKLSDSFILIDDKNSNIED
jgi:predicted nuclease with TOPRIM domain